MPPNTTLRIAVPASVLAFFLVCFTAPPAEAQFFDSTYLAASGRFPDEGCIGWDSFGNANTQPAIVDDVLVLTTTFDGDNQYYAGAAPYIGTPPVLNVEFTMQYVSGSSATEGRTPAAVGFTMSEENLRSVLYIQDGAIFLLASNNERGPEAIVATSDDFHDYRITADTTTGEVEVYYDGEPVLQGVSFVDTQVTGVRMHWGDGSLYAHGESHWTFFQHNAFTQAPINMVCGDPVADASVGRGLEVSVTTATDALLALRASVGSMCCELCACDVDDSGGVTATDALMILQAAIGAGPLLACPPCP